MNTEFSLIADIGGTHARFAIVENNAVTRIDVLQGKDYASIADAARAYLAKHAIDVRHAAISIASAILPESDDIFVANLPAWNTTQKALKSALNLENLTVINDFEALAHGIAVLDNTDSVKICGGTPVSHAPVGVIGPGTGLGMAAIVFIDGMPHVIASEGGNATLPATSAREYTIIDTLRTMKGDGQVSAEDCVSGTGLPMLYQAIAKLDTIHVQPLSAPDITTAALNKTCPVAIEAMTLFCHWLGVMAGNMALTFNTTGGVYIAGGIVPQWIDHLRSSSFANAFTNKGISSHILRDIPVFVVTHPYPALEGMRAVLSRLR